MQKTTKKNKWSFIDFLEYKSLKKESCFYPELGHWQASP